MEQIIYILCKWNKLSTYCVNGSCANMFKKGWHVSGGSHVDEHCWSLDVVDENVLSKGGFVRAPRTILRTGVDKKPMLIFQTLQWVTEKRRPSNYSCLVLSCLVLSNNLLTNIIYLREILRSRECQLLSILLTMSIVKYITNNVNC